MKRNDSEQGVRGVLLPRSHCGCPCGSVSSAPHITEPPPALPLFGTHLSQRPALSPLPPPCPPTPRSSPGSPSSRSCYTRSSCTATCSWSKWTPRPRPATCCQGIAMPCAVLVTGGGGGGKEAGRGRVLSAHAVREQCTREGRGDCQGGRCCQAAKPTQPCMSPLAPHPHPPPAPPSSPSHPHVRACS